MSRLVILVSSSLLLCASSFVAAQARVSQQGRAVVEFTSPAVKAVAAYEYSRGNHRGAWLLIELAVLAKERIEIHRNQISLLTPDERRIPLASQREFLDAQAELTQLLQNATVSRRPLGLYFVIPLQPTIQFFSFPGRIVHDTFITNQDEAAAGDLFFKSPDGRWPAGEYQLRVNHEQAPVQLPITLD
jgi:hypothetical protein